MELSEVYSTDIGTKVLKTREGKIRDAWRKELVKQKYNTLVTLQQPMRSRHQMDSRLKHFSEHQRMMLTKEIIAVLPLLDKTLTIKE